MAAGLACAKGKITVPDPEKDYVGQVENPEGIWVNDGVQILRTLSISIVPDSAGGGAGPKTRKNIPEMAAVFGGGIGGSPLREYLFCIFCHSP